MNLASPFIHRPVATALLAVGLFLVGVVGYSLLPVASLPNVDFPTLQVSASLPGANPETMASNVATPLERQFSLIPGISQMTSVNALGSTSITLQFELSQNLTDDFEQVQAAINAASAQLPTNLPAQPTIRKVNPSDAPIMILSLRSDTLPLDQVDNYADVILSQQFSRIDGVGLVNIGGQQKPAVRIQIDPRKVAARGLQIDAVRQQHERTASLQAFWAGQFLKPYSADTTRVLERQSALGLAWWPVRLSAPGRPPDRGI